MKRLACILLLACCLVLSAQATRKPSYIESSPLNISVEALDHPGIFGPFIFRMVAPNGQTIHFISQFEYPVAHSVDVNFDGVEDLAVMVDSGATNSVYRLFIRQGDQFVPADHGEELGLFNPAFYASLGLVGSHGTSGEAGALHEDVLYRWQGTSLVPVRRAVCEHLRAESMADNLYTTTTNYDLLHARVLAPSPEGGSEVVLHEEVHNMRTMGMEKAYDAFYQREQDALWQGLGN